MKTLSRRMRTDWNRRARQDYRYYVALGRWSQSWEEFSRGAAEVVGILEHELERLTTPATEGLRALEIGCGPGRLMGPLSRHFVEIHGVDVSTEMVALARTNLDGIGHAHVHASNGTDLSLFEDDYFDFVYSYAVFQHIPSPDVIANYLKEARRVLKAGGTARVHFNGSQKTIDKYDTWAGTKHDSEEIVSIAREQQWLLIALDNADTTEMWATLVKPSPNWSAAGQDASTEAEGIVVRDVTPAEASQTEVPAHGRYASFALEIEKLPARADLRTLRAFVSGQRAQLKRIEPGKGGIRRAIAEVPRGLTIGHHPVQLTWDGARVGTQGSVRIVAPALEEPRIVAVTDGIFVGCGQTISSKTVKVYLDGSNHPEQLRATLNGQPTRLLSAVCGATNIPSYHISFKLPVRGLHGVQRLECWFGERSLGVFEVDIAEDRFWWWRYMHPAEVCMELQRKFWIVKKKYWDKQEGSS